MRVTRLHLRNFRNHADTTFEFGTGINALLGDNGQGKTNVIEAIAYVGLTKSFYAASDAVVVRLGTEAFDIETHVRTAAGVEHTVSVRYVRDGSAKTLEVNHGRPETLASVIGQFPVVVLSPEHGAVTSGAPTERRKFMDILLSQVNRTYLDDLFEYRRVLHQRNRCLADGRIRGGAPASALEPWSEGLIACGSRVVHRRRLFLEEFEEFVKKEYRLLAGEDEAPGVAYATFAAKEEGGSVEAIALQYRRGLDRCRGEEMRRGISLVGPHRDEIQLTLNGNRLQQFASQGQHKTFLVALKLAEFLYMRERGGEAPLLLLDDVFSELDHHRTERILHRVDSLGQCIITSTDEHAFHGAVPWNGEHRRFLIVHGTSRPFPRSPEERAAGISGGGA